MELEHRCYNVTSQAGTPSPISSTKRLRPGPAPGRKHWGTLGIEQALGTLGIFLHQKKQSSADCFFFSVASTPGWSMSLKAAPFALKVLVHVNPLSSSNQIWKKPVWQKYRCSHTDYFNTSVAKAKATRSVLEAPRVTVPNDLGDVETSSRFSTLGDSMARRVDWAVVPAHCQPIENKLVL